MQKYILIAACMFTAHCYTMDSKDHQIQELAKRVVALEKTVYELKKLSINGQTISSPSDATVASYKALDNASKQESLTSVLKPSSITEALDKAWSSTDSDDEH